MSALISVDVRGLAGLKRQFDILAMPPTQRKKLLRLVAYRLRGDCQKRVRKRIDLNGKPFHPHPGHTKRKHTFDIVAKYLSVTDLSDKTANLGWTISGRSKLAWKIQFGSTEYVHDNAKTVNTVDQLKQKLDEVDKLKKEPACSLAQARQLVAYGYRQYGEKKRKPATVRWLRGKLNEAGRRVNYHMTYKKAALILDDIRRRGYLKSRTELGTDETGKVKIPARSFLGATQQEIVNYMDTIFEQMEQELKRNGTR
ncbi:MAG: hypothetical protein ACXWE9_00890 [Methylobacter sp.]